MTKDQNLWIISDDNELRESLQSTLNSKYMTRFFYSYGDFMEKQSDQFKSTEQPKLYLFDYVSAKRFFYDERNVNIDPAHVIVLGDDDPAHMRLFYSIGLANYFLKKSYRNQLLVKIEFMLGELLTYTHWNLEDLKWHVLTFKEKKILKVLCHRPDQLVDRSEIIKFVWRNEKVHSRTFDVHLHNLRKKLEKYGYEIVTHGQGKYQILNQAALKTA